MTGEGVVYKGSCACGKVQFSAKGQPIAQDYCHCQSCRLYHGALFCPGVYFRPSDFAVDAGQLFKVNLSPGLDRFSCGACRSPIYNSPASADIISTFPMLIEGLNFSPQYHMWCSDAMPQISALKDGLPRYPEWAPEEVWKLPEADCP